MPTVSVIIPTYEAAGTLPRALESVLDQTFTDLEVVVVDDASTDGTRDVVEEFAARDDRVSYCRHATNRGASAARNTGIDRSSGEYVAFLDADDEWLPRKLESQLDCLESRDSSWVGVYCEAHLDLTGRLGWMRNGLSRLLGFARQPQQREAGRELIGEILANRLHTHAGSSLVVRRETAEAVDGFDESFDRFQDPEFLVRVLERGKLAFVDEPLVVRHDPDDTPPASVVAASSRRFLAAFADHVERAEREGFNVRAAHHLSLARLYFSEGHYIRGLGYLNRSRIGLADVPGLTWALLVGLYTRSLRALAALRSIPAAGNV